MIKGVIRLVGFLLSAAGFVVIVIDGTSSIAAGALRYTRLQDTALQLFPVRFAEFGPRLARIHPLLWDPAATTALQTPTALALIALGVVFLLLGRKNPEQIGYPARL